jgi:hypothetical protein
MYVYMYACMYIFSTLTTYILCIYVCIMYACNVLYIFSICMHICLRDWICFYLLKIVRALGDCQLKEGNNRIVVPDPEISAFSPSKKDQFIIVATDGLWDVMSSQSAVEYVNNILVDEDLLG